MNLPTDYKERLMSSVVEWLKRNQPIATTGIVPHCVYWALTKGGDYRYDNPNFSGNKEEEVAIYCVHGTADRSDAFARIAERLLDKSLPSEISSINLVGFDERFRGKSIKFFSRQLGDKIVANGHKRVILLGHSRGGLIIADFAQHLSSSLEVCVLMSACICAPFGGSDWAWPSFSFFSSSLEEMQVDSKYLQNLNRSIADAPECPYLFIGAEQDYIVKEDQAFILDYVKKHEGSLCIFDRHGHLSIMSSHRLVNLLSGGISQCLEQLPAVSTFVDERNISEDYKPKA